MRRLPPLLCLLSASLLAGSLPAQDSASLLTAPSPFGALPLPAAQAFALSALVELPDRVLLLWDIEEGYYLYRKSLALTPLSGGERIGAPELPTGKQVVDEFFGEVEIYRDQLRISLPLAAGPAAELELSIQYQGCAEDRYCYPLQESTVRLALP